MKHSTKLLVIIATAVSTVAFAGVGWALWATTGTGSASSSAGTLAAPTNVHGTSTAGTGTVDLSWTPALAPNGVTGDLGYWVRHSKDGGTYVDACASSYALPLKPSTVSSCSDTGLTTGSYTYTVTAVFKSWTAQSVVAGGPVTVTTGPTVTLAAPSSRGQGAVSQAVVISGTGFVSGATASFSGGGITVNSTTFTSATSVTANITVAAAATTGARDVTVTNPAGAGAGTLTGGFTVTTGPTITSPTAAAPHNPGRNAGPKTITVAGTNFVTGLTVTASGGNWTVSSFTFIDANSISVTLSGSGTLGNLGNLTVTNPDGGTVTSSNCLKNG
jgi:hypothetical protein